MGKWGGRGRRGGEGGVKCIKVTSESEGGRGRTGGQAGKKRCAPPKRKGGVAHAHKRAAFTSNKCDSSARGKGGISKTLGGEGGASTRK